MASEARATVDRRLAFLQALATRAGEAGTVGEAAALLEGALRTNPDDLPFSAIYLLDRERPRALLVMVSSAHGRPTLPESIPVEAGDPWRFADALVQNEPILVRLADLSAIPSPEQGGDPPVEAAVLRPAEPLRGQTFGVFVAGLNPAGAREDGYGIGSDWLPRGWRSGWRKPVPTRETTGRRPPWKRASIVSQGS